MTNDRQKSVLESCVRAVWSRMQRKHFSSGLLSLVRWGIPLFLLGMGLDWLTDLPTAGRALVLAVLVCGSIYKAWQSGWRHLCRFDAARTAMAIEQQQGGLESLLVTAVQFGKSGPASGTSTALWDATQGRAEESARDLQPRKIVNFKALKVPTVIAAIFAGLILVFSVWNGPLLSAGLARIFTPWAKVVYPTKTILDPGEGDLVVKEGESVKILIGVSGVVPERGQLFLRTGEEGAREIDLEITDGGFEYTIASASRDFSYRIKAGDAKSEWSQVRVISAPRIESVQVALEFPAYLERTGETVEALTLTVPEETKVHWQLTLDRPIRDAVLNRDGEEPMKLEVSDGGRKLVIDELVDASRGYSFSWVEEEHGFEFASPRYYLQVASDQAPRVELTSPESNLSALLGRQADLAVRAYDDHGIAETTVTYRVNLRPEKVVVLPSTVNNGDGEQVLEWDYREALPELEVGDTVSFVVEVADKYPGPDGPHKARSETRRITFLSREDYLAQIERKKDRLLARVRTIYRQERDAHELVRNLDPRSESFRQTCQLEAIRQEMLREQLNDTAGEVQALLDDLESNKVTDAVEGDVLVRVRDGLESIAEDWIAKAASLLREQTGAVIDGKDGKPDPTPAIQVVNQAARELAGLVLQRGIDSAREVFARESHMLAQEQATLRLFSLQSKAGEEAGGLALRQEELGVWTGELISSLRQEMRYDKRPVSVLGLTRRIKELRSSGAEERMGKAAALIKEGKNLEAADLHAEIIPSLLDAEFSMRTGAEYASIMEFRAKLDLLLKNQEELRVICAAKTAEGFKSDHLNLASKQAELQAAIVSSLLPPVPASRARLFDKTLPELPPVDQRRADAERAMGEAMTRLQAGEQEQALEKQLETGQHLSALVALLDQSSLELSLRTQGLNSLVSTATERVTRLEDYEARQIVLLERTEEVALDEGKAGPLLEPQQFLAGEIEGFRQELLAKGDAEKDVVPLLSRLNQLSGIFGESGKALRENRPEDALEYQEAVADLLAEARELVQAQGERLALLQSLYTFQRSVGNANDWMLDIVAEQNDLISETKAIKEEDGGKLVPVMNNLRQCLTDIAPVLDLVAGRLDAGTPLVFANTDLEDAVFAIEDEDLLEALDAQEVAVESLVKVQRLVAAVQGQTGYVAEIVEFLHTAQADVALMAFRQKQLRQQVSTAGANLQPAFLEEQKSLLDEALTCGSQLTEVTGMDTHSGAGKQMREAGMMLKAGNAAAATSQMELAEASLNATAEELFLVITMLHGLPSIEVLSTSPVELELLLEVLAFASDQRDLSRETEAARPDNLPALAARQAKLEKASAKALRLDPPHPMLITAHQRIAAAAGALQSSDGGKSRRNQDAADQVLRHFIVEQALILETAKLPGSSSDEPVLTEAETDDLSESVANFVSDFVSGEAPKDQRTEWEVLGSRNRAALNQNFARELPLEFRGTLKNYYERVAK